MHGRSMLALAAVFLLAGCSDGDGGGEDTGSASDSPATGSTTATGTSGGAPPNAATPVPPAQLEVATAGVYPVNPGYAPQTLSVAAGANVTLTFRNEDPNPVVDHDWFLEGTSARTDAIGSGESTTLAFVAPGPGTYTFYCGIGDHRQRGMEGTLTVT